ncbi:MAG TPA: tetratricopeptide repeat protein [Gemmatimonadota bacterium]|nr:tetratricopeptide repeat protein [Gemmatimonadota bacterium]
MNSYQQLFAELKRRKVFKVAAVYGAVAFGLIQVADPLGQALRLPDTFLPFVLAILLLGFPVALVLAWAFEVTPDGVQRTGAAAPGEIEAMVAEPASKRWPAGLLALAGAAALLGGVWWAGLQTGRADSGGGATAMTSDSLKLAYTDVAEDARPSIAVLPFADMSREGDQEYFSDGMTEELLNTLANIRELRVSGRTSTFAYKDQGEDLRTIGSELGVQYLVEGSVRKDEDELRITAQLIDASDGSHLWSDTYDRKLESVFAIQTEIATSIADQLRVPLGLSDPSQLVNPVEDLEVYDLYLAARARMRLRGEALNEAVDLFGAALARDSTWAPAWAGLAEATEVRLWYDEPWNGVYPDSATVHAELEAAERAARRALELDPRSPSAHVALGSVLRNRFEWEASERAYRAALAIDPDNAEAHQQLGELLFSMGRVGRAVGEVDRAAVLDPAPIRFYVLGNALQLDDREVEAIEAYDLGIRLDPENHLWALRRNLGRIHLHAGRYDEARRYYGDDPDDRRRAAMLQKVDIMQRGAFVALPDSARRFLDPVNWMQLGEPDSAAAALAAFPPDGLEISFNYIVWYPVFDGLRSRPVVRAAMREHGLANLALQRTPAAGRQRPAALRTTAEDAP